MSPLYNSTPGFSVLHDTLTTINLLTLNPLSHIGVDNMDATDKKLAHRRNMLMAMDTIAHEINNEDYLYGPWFTAGIPDCNTVDERNYWIDYIANDDELYMDTVKCFMSIMKDIIATKDMHNLTY